MIEIIGESGTSEFSAAAAVAEAIGELWPGLETSPASQEHVRIAANVKISGYRVSDIDVVVCGVFQRERKFIPRKVLNDTKGRRVIRKPVTVQNFVVAIEVKEHSESGVQIVGDKIEVKYSRGGKTKWHSATDQNVDQVHSLAPYLIDLGHSSYVHRCVIMRGLASINVGGALPSTFSGIDFFTALASLSRVRPSANGYILSSGTNSEISPILNAPIFSPVMPTTLDRKRMDTIVVSTPESDRLYSLIGNKMVCLRGHGGTGKTVMLLQAAWRLFDERGLRTLVLTYNHALAADIRRLLALLKVPSNIEDGGISVQTVMSFMYSWFHRLELLDDEESSYEDYGKHCDAALEMLKAGAITRDDIIAIISNSPSCYDFDCVIVDEAQDWPQGEADLIKSLYRQKNICLADGVDQLIRGVRPNWEHGLADDTMELIPLQRCLRMKRNLAVFANKVAEAGGVKWKVTPNDIAGGGRIIVLSRPYHDYDGLHEELVNAAKDGGNAELDFLFCVPPSSVISRDGTKSSDMGDFLSGAGYEVWEGVDETARKDFPRSKKQFRVVQYASCRGLEGWTVILQKADQYWEECRAKREARGLTAEQELAYEDLEEVSAMEAWHRILIALTRPIDSLVICLDNKDSAFSAAIIEIANNNPDFVEILD